MEYNSIGKLIHYNDSDGLYENWYEYDLIGNLINEKKNTGWEAKYKYDTAGNQIYCIHTIDFGKKTVFETWTEYNSEGNEIHLKNANGYPFAPFR